MTDHPAEGTPLLPCPFCGKLDVFAERFDLSSCYIQCNDCGAQGPTCCQDSDDEEMPGEDAARRAWNTRHSQGGSASTAQISELDDASNACLELAAKHGFATGHGDTVADMIREFSAQIRSPAESAKLRAALLEIEQTTIDHVAVKIARAALSREEGSGAA